MSEPTPTVHELRRRWKPTKERLAAERGDHPTNIRVHRACSWLQRVEDLGDDHSDDEAMILRWIAFNSLYGRWNVESREPHPDRATLHDFLDQVDAIDRDDRLPEILEAHKRLVMCILDDEYLARFFWEEPTDARARKSKKAKFDARTWYVEGRYGRVMGRLVERLYFQRCQLVHGAATFDSQLNRASLRHCSTMLGHLLPALLLAIIDHGADEDWGALCYPPLW
jgi:hypothetical protein